MVDEGTPGLPVLGLVHVGFPPEGFVLGDGVDGRVGQTDDPCDVIVAICRDR